MSLLRDLQGDLVIRLGEGQQEITQQAPDGSGGPGLLALTQQRSAELHDAGRLRTAETYRSAALSLERFLQGADVSVAQVDAPLMQRYEAHLQQRGLTPNTVSFYMRILRAVYNRAVADGLTTDRQPFHRVYTGSARTVKRAVNMDTIRCIKNLNIKEPAEAFARDMFLFSFYARGMAFVDMAYLRRSNISHGQLTYQRHKTGQRISLRWEPALQELADRYPGTCRDFLLPIIHTANGHERSQYRRKQDEVNRGLKRVGAALNLPTLLSFYVARHSWASIARDMGIPTEAISHAMGHTSEQTTRIYLKTLDPLRLDNLCHELLERL